MFDGIAFVCCVLSQLLAGLITAPVAEGRRMAASSTTGLALVYYLHVVGVGQFVCIVVTESILCCAWVWILTAVVDCGNPGTPAHGNRVNSEVFTYGATASFICDGGYQLVGAQLITCQANGAWSNPIPACSSRSLLINSLVLFFCTRLWEDGFSFLDPICCSR